MAAKGKKTIAEWEAKFKEADKDKSGSLSVHEMRDVLKEGDCKMKDSQIADIFIDIVGPKGRREMSKDEFVQGMIKLEKKIADITLLFKAADRDNSGFLERAEFANILRHIFTKITEEEIKEILDDADSSGDGKISLQEFLSACT